MSSHATSDGASQYGKVKDLRGYSLFIFPLTFP